MRQVGPGVWLTSSLGIESLIMAALLLKWCTGTRAGNEYKSVQILLIEASLHSQIQHWSFYIPHICTKNGEIFVVSEFSMGWGLPQWGRTSFSFCRPSFPRRMLKHYCILHKMTEISSSLYLKGCRCMIPTTPPFDSSLVWDFCECVSITYFRPKSVATTQLCCCTKAAIHFLGYPGYSESFICEEIKNIWEVGTLLLWRLTFSWRRRGREEGSQESRCVGWGIWRNHDLLIG